MLSSIASSALVPGPHGQMNLVFPATKQRWGGRRAGAGRPRSEHPRGLPHRARPYHDAHHPVHVTLRARRHLGSLRRRAVTSEILRAFRVAAADPVRTQTFRVVHFSVQPDHLHLIVEGTSKVALGRGLQGLVSRLARRINATLGRRGAVFADRYHGRALPTGSCPTVGVTGLTQGGGVGVLTRAYGLTCDHLTSARVVLASGQSVTASADSHPDLF